MIHFVNQEQNVKKNKKIILHHKKNIRLELYSPKYAQVTALFGHHRLEARKMVSYIHIEQVVGTEYKAVAGKREFPADFQQQAERNVARS